MSGQRIEGVPDLVLPTDSAFVGQDTVKKGIGWIVEREKKQGRCQAGKDVDSAWTVLVLFQDEIANHAPSLVRPSLALAPLADHTFGAVAAGGAGLVKAPGGAPGPGGHWHLSGRPEGRRTLKLMAGGEEEMAAAVSDYSTAFSDAV